MWDLLQGTYNVYARAMTLMNVPLYYVLSFVNLDPGFCHRTPIQGPKYGGESFKNIMFEVSNDLSWQPSYEHMKGVSICHRGLLPREYTMGIPTP